MFNLASLRVSAESLLSSPESRVVFHPPESTLNIMLVKIDEVVGESARRPHANRDRDELFFVVKGSVTITTFTTNGVVDTVTIADEGDQSFRFIPAGQFHQLTSEKGEAVVLELIGGKFLPESTISLGLL